MTAADAAGGWLDERAPHEAERSARQVAGVLARLGPDPRRVLDLGCGAGRLLVPLAAAGHDVVGLDHAASALDACRVDLAAAGVEADLRDRDFLDAAPWPDGPFDAVLCLGNTLMTIADVEVAADLLRRAGAALGPAGVVLLDDCPHDFWPELTEGNWATGLAEDGSMQMIWAPGDAVFTIRTGDDVDEASWSIAPEDRLFRLWSLGAVRLAAVAAGLSGPAHDAEAGLLILGEPSG